MPVPVPEPGLVIAYSYLWHDEQRAGREEGRKTRPALIVAARRRAGSEFIETIVLPITHAAPADPADAVEIPPRVKAHLGLDEARSWIVVAEGNRFVWPGFDLRRRNDSDRYDYGFLPPRLFAAVIAAFVERYRAAPRIAERG